jgi:aromatic ring-opening dioxygenase catalytic subunit (LigB family)
MQRAPLDRERGAPAARIAHPREEHLIPLMVATGTAGEDSATLACNGTFGGARLSAYRFLES